MDVWLIRVFVNIIVFLEILKMVDLDWLMICWFFPRVPVLGILAFSLETIPRSTGIVQLLT